MQGYSPYYDSDIETLLFLFESEYHFHQTSPGPKQDNNIIIKDINLLICAMQFNIAEFSP